MTQYIDKNRILAEIRRRFDEYSSSILKHYDVYKEAKAQELGKILTIIDTLEVKDVDLELITHWFDHIAQIADDRKTANGTVMEDWAALDEIKCLAKNSSEFIKKHYKTQKGE